MEFTSLGDTELIVRVQKSVDFLVEDQALFDEYLSKKSSELEKYQRLTILN